MSPSSPDDRIDFEERVRDEIRGHENVEGYEIVESTPKHVLVRVTEHAAEDETRTVLYRLHDESRPEGGAEIHWEYLGPAVADDGVEDEESNP